MTPTGFINYEELCNEVLSTVDFEDDIRDLMEEVYKSQNIDLDN